MRIYFLLLIMLNCVFSAKAQLTKADYYNNIDNKIYTFSKHRPNAVFDTITTFVNASFTNAEDKVRAYYTWIALNIVYDTDYMNNLNLISTFNINTIASSNQKAEDVMKNKKAVCEGYSNLMSRLCKSSSIPCFMVCGYTKDPSGEIPAILHAWNAVKIDSAWGLLDITWSSGYLDLNHNYVKRFSNQYFLTKPKLFITDHFPLDPMWQLMKYPFTKKNFEDDSLINANAPLFNFPDSIQAYKNQSEKEQLYLDFLHYHRAEPTNQTYAHNLDVFNNNLIADKLNIGLLYQEDFIALAKKKLSVKPTIADCKKARILLDSAQSYNHKAQIILNSRTACTTQYKTIFNSMQQSLNDNAKSIKLNYNNLNKLQAYLKKK